MALGLLLATPALAAPIAPSFSAATGSPVAAGNGPSGLAPGLFNADATLDLAVSDEGGGGNSIVTVFSGAGTGAFASASTPAVANKPESLVAGRFDAGTTLDLAVANSGSDSVSILRGNGNGTFTAGTAVTVGNKPLAIATGDIDNDGAADLAVANNTSNTVSILRGDGLGGFTSLAAPATGSRPSAVALARINADANLDLLTANQNADTVTLRLGNGNGTFAATATTITVGNGPSGLATGDLNLDGAIDVAVANASANTVSILLGNGAGTLTLQASSPSTGSSSSPVAVAIADLNGDADADLVTANSGNARASVFAGNGDGSFAAHLDLTTGSAPVAVATGDINGDFRQDVMVGNRTSDTVTVMLNTTPTTVSVAAPASLAFGSGSPGATLGPVAQSVTVVSNARGGYQLSAARSVFTRGDIPLTVSATAPSGTLLDLVAGANDIPTSGSRNIGHRTLTTTRSAGDVWSLGLSLGPIPFVAAGSHTSTLTYTVVGLP